MKYTWDEAKRQANIEKHGIDFADVPPMFDTVKHATSHLDSCNIV